jgi:Uri superfamily endonuclease
MNELTREPGTYALGFSLPRAARIRAGALGERELGPGVFVYVGSAFGPGGLRARVMRHLRGAAKRHWHVDSLRAVAAPEIVAVCAAPARLECAWVAALRRRAGARAPWPNFGASDCRCEAHLVAMQPEGGLPRVFSRALRAGRDPQPIAFFSVRIEGGDVELELLATGGERENGSKTLDVP